MRLATALIDGYRQPAIVIRDPRSELEWLVTTGGPGNGAGEARWESRDYTLQTLLDDLAGSLTQLRPVARAWDELMLAHDPHTPIKGARLLSEVTLCAPIPQPGLLFGLVGNNAGFLRADPARGRNLELPAGHQRPATGLVGAGDAIVVPREATSCRATTELAVVIGLPGRNIDEADALHHIAGYSIINDLVVDCYTRSHAIAGADFPIESATGFHVRNAGSWLDKSVDTMCSLGPFLVTPDEVPDPYDLIAWYSQDGAQRDRSHSSALTVGIAALISWASRLFELRPGMVLHLGAMGRDGIDVRLPESAPTVIEAGIESVGILRNSVVHEADAESPAVVTPSAGWVRPAAASSFWAAMGNSAAAVRYNDIQDAGALIAYNVPRVALGIDGSVVRLPTGLTEATITTELAVTIESPTRNVTPNDAQRAIGSYSALIAVRADSSRSSLLAPHRLSANMPAVYERWHDGTNVLGEPVTATEWPTNSVAISCTVVGVATSTADLADYTRPAAELVAELSRWITLWPGDVVTLGIVGDPIRIDLTGQRECALQARIGNTATATARLAIGEATGASTAPTRSYGC